MEDDIIKGLKFKNNLMIPVTHTSLDTVDDPIINKLSIINKF